MPPVQIWDPIQQIRRGRDKGFFRWILGDRFELRSSNASRRFPACSARFPSGIRSMAIAVESRCATSN